MTIRLARQTTDVARLPLHDHPSNHGLAYQNVTFRSTDGLTLRGWYLPSLRDDRCIILVQGEEHHRNSPGIRALELGGELVARGYSVLLFDLRARGESDGQRSSAGNQELLDVMAAIAYVKHRGIVARRIGLLGFSLGAVLAIYAALREPEIPCLVCDSPFSDLLDDFRHLRLGPAPVPGWLSAALVVLMAKTLYGSDPGQMRPIKAISKLHPRPIFFIHGEDDVVVSPQETLALWRQYHNPANRLWIAPGAGHVHTYSVAGEEYVRQVVDFFDSCIG